MSDKETDVSSLLVAVRKLDGTEPLRSLYCLVNDMDSTIGDMARIRQLVMEAFIDNDPSNKEKLEAVLKFLRDSASHMLEVMEAGLIVHEAVAKKLSEIAMFKKTIADNMMACGGLDRAAAEAAADSLTAYTFGLEDIPWDC